MQDPSISSAAQAQPSQARKAYSYAALSLFVMAAVCIGLQLALLLGLTAALPQLAQQQWYLTLCTFAPLYLVAMPIALLLLRRLPAAAPQPHALPAGQLLRIFLMCVGVMYVGNLVGTLLSGLLSAGTAQNPLESYVSNSGVLELLVIVVAAPVLEELVFRKLLIDHLACYGGGLAVLFSGLAFGLFHMNFYQFFYAVGLGLLFAYVYLRTGKVVYCIGLHIAINFMGSVLAPAVLNFAGDALLDPSVPAAGLKTALYFGYVAALLAASVAGLVLLFRARKRFVVEPAARQLPKGQGKVAFLNLGMALYTLLCAVAIVLAL